MRRIWLTSLLVLLGGCAVPPAIQMASLVADGFSYVATGKSVTDHGISMVAGEDCAVFRAVKDEAICREEGQDSAAMAFAPAGEEEDLADHATADDDALAEDGLPPYEPTEATATAFALVGHAATQRPY